MKRRSTPSQQQIHQLLLESAAPLSHDQIEVALKGQMDRVTIYRILHRFEEDGLLHKVVSDDGKTYFALCRKCSNKNHHHMHLHFRCERCGKIECMPEEMMLRLPEGYVPAHANLFVSGYCRQCNTAV
jgi:Fur family ferric uptake transcriptional regulator